MKRKVLGRQMDHALAMLGVADKHRDGPMTVEILAELSGASEDMVRGLLADARDDKYGSVLMRAACKWRYDFVVYPIRSERLLDAVYRGYGE